MTSLWLADSQCNDDADELCCSSECRDMHATAVKAVQVAEAGIGFTKSAPCISSVCRPWCALLTAAALIGKQKRN
jgi:hypothetical protein